MDLQQELEELDGKSSEAVADGSEKDSVQGDDPTEDKAKTDGNEAKSEGTAGKTEM